MHAVMSGGLKPGFGGDGGAVTKQRRAVCSAKFLQGAPAIDNYRRNPHLSPELNGDNVQEA